MITNNWYGKIFEHSQTPKKPTKLYKICLIKSCFMLSITLLETLRHLCMLGHVLLADAQNKLRWITNGHRHSSKLWGGLMLRCCVKFPGKALGGATLSALDAYSLYSSFAAKQAITCSLQYYFCFSTFYVKAKILFGFISFSKNRY